MKRIVMTGMIAVAVVVGGSTIATADTPDVLTCPKGFVAYDTARGGGEFAYCEAGKRPKGADVVRLQKKVKRLQAKVERMRAAR